MAVDHIRRGAAFGMAVCPGEVALNDRPVTALDQRMAHETRRRAGFRGFPVQPRIRAGGREPRKASAGSGAALLIPETREQNQNKISVWSS